MSFFSIDLVDTAINLRKTLEFFFTYFLLRISGIFSVKSVSTTRFSVAPGDKMYLGSIKQGFVTDNNHCVELEIKFRINILAGVMER